jgi:hypothetical protein
MERARTGVDERAGAALELGVVALAVEHAAHLLHVGHPVDLGVCSGREFIILGINKLSKI